MRLLVADRSFTYSGKQKGKLGYDVNVKFIEDRREE